MSNDFVIISHQGEYRVFSGSMQDMLTLCQSAENFFIIDSKVKRLYEKELTDLLANGRYLEIDANEDSKTLLSVVTYINKLIASGVKKTATLVGIGGGVIQDITCFIATIYMRGINWKYYPTTLLPQVMFLIPSKLKQTISPKLPIRRSL